MMKGQNDEELVPRSAADFLVPSRSWERTVIGGSTSHQQAVSAIYVVSQTESENQDIS